MVEEEMFAGFQKELENDFQLKDELRLIVRELEQKARDLQTCLQKAHQCQTNEHIRQLCEKARTFLPDIQTLYAQLGSKIEKNFYYKYHGMFFFPTQRLVFLLSFMWYLETGGMLAREKAAELLGTKVSRGDGFHLDLEDYLTGLLMTASELSRFAVNSVTVGNYGRPFEIGAFLGELDAGFRLLNLKNDFLRKKFDSLKYDVKKVEEIVYDLTIRGLKPASAAAADAGGEAGKLQVSAE